MKVQAEVSLYPLREADLTPPIQQFIERLESRGLQVAIGPLSSTVAGDSASLFDALREAFEDSAQGGARVLVLKIIGGA